MRKVREVLRLTEMGRSQREVAAVLRISAGTVVGYLKRARVAALTWERAADMTDEAVEAELFRDVGRNLPTTRAPIPFAHVHQDLSRVGVTLQLLWEEYQAAALAAGGSVPYRYSQFCELYGAWRRRLSPTMRQVHRAGEKAFIDYSGKKPCIYDRHTGAAEPVELFVMVLGASNYTYAEATRTQRLADFTASVTRGLEYFGAAPEVLVPDQLRSAVRGSDWYDPLINEVFQDLAQHYGLAVLPARPRKPRDKAKVENAVLVAQRWIVARLRNRKFFSLSELNEAIAELLEELNARPFKKLEGCRQSAFLELDRPAMHPLPVVRFELRERHQARVNIDYHVEFDYRLYSVPYTLIGEQIEVRATVTVVEIFHAGERAASHARTQLRPTRHLGHLPRAPSTPAPATEVATRKAGVLGDQVRTGSGHRRGADARAVRPPRARLPGVSGHPARRRETWRRADAVRLLPRPGGELVASAAPQVHRGHPPTGARSVTAQPERWPWAQPERWASLTRQGATGSGDAHRRGARGHAGDGRRFGSGELAGQSMVSSSLATDAITPRSI